MKWSWVLLLAGCSDRPERPDPLDLPGPDDDDIHVPIPNDCVTRVAAFDVRSEGYVEADWSGIGLYEYRSPNKQTSIYLRPCDGDLATEHAIAMHFYGVARIEKGTYEFDRLALENGGFLFSFMDEVMDINCSDQPTGTVNITVADFRRVEGDFTVTAGCKSDELIGRIPRPTTFSGSFAASNIGLE